jgi:ferritin-like metal-binding protein YciE
MRDIRGDLQRRVNMVKQQIKAEHAYFEALTAQLKRERESRIEELKAQLQAVNRLFELTTWQHNGCFAAARVISGRNLISESVRGTGLTQCGLSFLPLLR